MWKGGEVNLDYQCVVYFYVPEHDPKQLRGGMFILGHSFREDTVHHGWEDMAVET